MIDYVIAAEFDIKQGVVIKSYYPKEPEIKNLEVLAAYMIPDGSHLFESDQY